MEKQRASLKRRLETEELPDGLIPDDEAAAPGAGIL
jgi:hypothetical protein